MIKHRKCTTHPQKALRPLHIIHTHTRAPSHVQRLFVARKRLSLLLGDTDSATTATGRLGVLATHTETPVVSETTVGADLLQALKILTELAVDAVGEDLRVLAIDDVALPVEEPGGDLVCGGNVNGLIRFARGSERVGRILRTLQRVLEDGDDALELFGSEVTGTLAEVDIGLLADQVGITATDTLNLGHGVHDLLLSIDVCVQQTDDVLEAVISQLRSLGVFVIVPRYGFEVLPQPAARSHTNRFDSIASSPCIRRPQNPQMHAIPYPNFSFS